MRVPFTRYGLPQLVVYPLLVVVVMILLFVAGKSALWLIPAEAFLFLVLLWMLSFFRDPPRTVVPDDSALLSPADGTVTDISIVESSVLGTPEKPARAVRIGMFLSIFNVHINRAPIAVRIEKVTYKKGRFKNAMDPESSRVNESNDILMSRLSDPSFRLLVRQVSGAVARHIVCEAKEGAEFGQGETFGMIKFGSRTELYFPAGDEGSFTVLVKKGDPVRAGLSSLVRFNP